MSFGGRSALFRVFEELWEGDVQRWFISAWNRYEDISVLLVGCKLVDSVPVGYDNLYSVGNRYAFQAFSVAGYFSIDGAAGFRPDVVV